MDEYFMSVHHTHHRAKQRTPQTRWLKSVGSELHRVQGKKRNIAVPISLPTFSPEKEM